MDLRTPAATVPGRRATWPAVISWALYDFAGTVFSVSILSVYFPLWLGSELGAGADTVNYAAAGSALLVLLFSPFLGAVSDLGQRRKPYLVVLVSVSVVFTALLGVSGEVAVIVALFVAANFCYQSATVFYNALLPGVSAGRGTGRVSGYGTALGYVGAIFALLFLQLFVGDASAVKELLGPLGWWIGTGAARSSNAFVPTAVLYLLFSLPAFFFVPDPKVRRPMDVRPSAVYRDVIATIRNLRSYPGAGTFIAATVLYTDAANTAVSNMALYGREVFGMSSGGIRNLLLFSTVFAIVGSAGFGHLSDRVGPKRALVVVLLLWLGAIALAAVAPGPRVLLLVGPVVGVALGATWTVSRAMLVALAPPEKTGEFFGLYNLAGRFSAVAGPALIALLLDAFGGLGAPSYRIAIGALAIVVLAGLYLLSRTPDVRPSTTPPEYHVPPDAGA